jgi:hypothetical protein
MAKALAIVALAALTGAGSVSAGSTNAQLTVGVTVVRSCAVDTRAAEPAAPRLRLTCAAGAQSTLRVTETVHTPSTTLTSDGDRLLTLNF